MRRYACLLSALILVLAGCGDGSDGADPGWTPDVTEADPGGPSDAEADEGDATPIEDTVEIDLGPPDPETTFWVRERTACVPDGPWEIDTVAQVRTLDGLPDLDVRTFVLDGNEIAWAGTASGLARMDEAGARFDVVADLPGAGPVSALAALASGVRLARGPWVGATDLDGVVVAGFDADVAVDRLADCDGDGYAVSGGRILRIGPEALQALAHEAPGSVHDVACVASIPWVATDDGLFRLDDGGWVAAWQPEAAVRVVAAAGGRVVASTGEAVVVVDAGGVEVVAFEPGPGGLPTGGVTSLALSPDGLKLAVGHGVGATRIDLADGRVDHFVSRRWLPDNAVSAVHEASDGTLWVATPAGLSALTRVETTLEAKAMRMFDRLDGFWRLGGFVSPWSHLADPWDDEPLPRWDDDNDGQWTQEAVGALCYAYATTGDEAFYEAARRAVTNMVMLVDIPSVDFEAAGLGRGFITRSFVRDDEGAVFDDKAARSNWHHTSYKDGHEYYWKDDTSSDEVTGHLFGFSLYYDLCAKDDAERAWVGEALGALAGYIVDHDFTLPDLDGEPTTHGDWNPSRIPIAIDGVEACMDAGHELVTCLESHGGGGFLDALEVLALMLSAYHVTGDARFWTAYDALVRVHRYDRAATFHDQIVTWAYPAMANYCDHELADLALLTLIRYEHDPIRRTHWIDQMLAAWEYEEGERNPVKSLAMAAFLDEVPGLEAGVSTLVDYPEDLRHWLVDNNHRVDYRRNGTDRSQQPQFREVPPYDEITIKRWDHNPYRIADGGSGTSRMTPTFWLLPYWGLRYHNAICVPPKDQR